MTGLVFDIQHYAIHDGPGIRTSVFLKGCPLHCGWCHNPESRPTKIEITRNEERCIECGACIEACPEHVASATAVADSPEAVHCIRCGTCVEVCPSSARTQIGHRMSVDEVLTAIEKDRVFYQESGGGVTFTGGEPLLQAHFLAGCLALCKERGYHTAVDTSGYAPRNSLIHVAEHTDLFLIDLKLMDDSRHREYVGASNRGILDNVTYLVEQHHKVWVRFPLIPGVNDDDANLDAMTSFLSDLKSAVQLHVLPYHRYAAHKYRRLGEAQPVPDLEPPTGQHTRAVADRLAASGLRVNIGG